MRLVCLLPLLAACNPGRPVVMWATPRATGEERIELVGNGDITFIAINNGAEDRSETNRLAREQLAELHDMLREHRACELAHEADYTPGADELQTTLTLAFPDLQCRVTLWAGEWQRGHARDIADTMRSMRRRPH